MLLSLVVKRNTLCCYLMQKVKCFFFVTAMLLSYVESEVFLLLYSVKSKVCKVAISRRQQCVLICCLQQTAECVMLLSLVESKVKCVMLLSVQESIHMLLYSKEYVISCYLIESKLCYIAILISQKTKYDMLLSSVVNKVLCYKLQSSVDSKVC